MEKFYVFVFIFKYLDYLKKGLRMNILIFNKFKIFQILFMIQSFFSAS